MSVTSLNDVTQMSHLPRPNVTKMSNFETMSKFVPNRLEYVCYDLSNVPTKFSDPRYITVVTMEPFSSSFHTVLKKYIS